MAIKECVICGAQFSTSSSSAKTCSKKCSYMNRRQTEREYRRRNPEFKIRRREYEREKRITNADWAESERKRNREARANDIERYRECYREYYRKQAANNPDFRQRCNMNLREFRNSQSTAASMLEACAAMIQISEMGIHDETE